MKEEGSYQFNEFLESLKYSRDKCMLFHGFNFVAIFFGFIVYFFVWETFKDAGNFRIYLSFIPGLIILSSLYLVSLHDLSYIENKINTGKAIWRDKIEYKISKFAKAIYFKK